MLPSQHSWLLSFHVSNSDMDFNGNGDILTCRKHFLSPDLPLLETPQLPPIMAPSPKQPPNSDFQGGSGLPSQGKQLSPHGHSNPNTILPCPVMPTASISNWRFSSQILPLNPTCPQAHSLYSTRRLNSDFTTNCHPSLHSRSLQPVLHAGHTNPNHLSLVSTSLVAAHCLQQRF